MEQLVSAIEHACAVFEVLELLSAVEANVYRTVSQYVSLCHKQTHRHVAC